MKKILAVILLFCISLFVFSGCEGDSANEIIYYEINEMPLTVDPQLASSGAELIIARNIYEGLMREDYDGKIVCAAAKEYSANGKTYTFVLRDDIKWSDEQPVTAQDFKYGYNRAKDPVNNAPYTEKLKCINSYNVINNNTLSIELSTGFTETQLFEALSLPVLMPCREDFFEECNGRYGMSTETTLTNGSYRLRLWDTENNKIRIWTNPHYNGNFCAKNSAVIFTKNTDKTAIQRLEDGNVDIAEISTLDITKAKQLKLNTAQFENTCWVLVMNDKKYSSALRQAFAAAFNTDKYSSSLIEGYNISKDIFPEVVKKGESLSHADIITVSPQTLYKNAVAGLINDNPGEIKIVYYNDPVMYNALVDIAGNWQNLFGVTVNLIPSDNLSLLQLQIISPSYDMCLVPLISADGDKDNYLKYFSTKETDLNKIQSSLLSSYKIIPVAVQNICYAHTSDLSKLKISLKTGIVDFSYVIKNS